MLSKPLWIDRVFGIPWANVQVYVTLEIRTLRNVYLECQRRARFEQA